MRPCSGWSAVAQLEKAAEHADVCGPVRADRHRRVVVVVAETLAAEALVDGPAGPEVERGEVPGVLAVGARLLRVREAEPRPERPLRHPRGRALAAQPPRVAAASVPAYVHALDPR